MRRATQSTRSSRSSGDVAARPRIFPKSRGFGIDDVATANARAEVNATRRTNTETALARGVFGVPTLVIGDELFWGDAATAMALAYRDDPTLFTHADDARIDALPMASVRKVVG